MRRFAGSKKLKSVPMLFAKPAQRLAEFNGYSEYRGSTRNAGYPGRSGR